jgi:hypothetical protein
MSNIKLDLSVAWNIYKSILYSIPYNSISQLYIYLKEINVPHNFGLPCVLQLNELVSRLVNAGFSYTGYLNHRHASIIVPIGGKEYLFDPYLLHSEPVCLSSLKENQYYNFKAFPYRKDKEGRTIPSQFRVQVSRKNETLNTRYAQFQSDDDKFLLIRRFRFDLGQTVMSLPPPSEIIPLFFHPEQTTLSIRVLCKSDSKVYQLIYPICWYFRSGMHSPVNIFLKLNSGEVITSSRSDYKFYFQKIADNTGLTKNDIIDFIMGGISIYEEYAPKEINFQNYKPAFS